MKLIFISLWHNWISWGKTININPGKSMRLLVTSMSCFQPTWWSHLCSCCDPAWGTHLCSSCLGKKKRFNVCSHSTCTKYVFALMRENGLGWEEGVKSGNGFFRGLTGRKIKGWWQIDLEQAEKSTAKFMGFKCSWPGVTAFNFSSLMQKGNLNLTGKQIFFSCLSLCWHSSELN